VLLLRAELTVTSKALKELIHARILAGQVSRYGQHRIFVGKGDGKPCAVCERVISRWETQYDIELRVDPRAAMELPMHQQCYDFWRNESLMLQKGHRSTGEPPEAISDANTG
jgi:hypothetical protein